MRNKTFKMGLTDLPPEFLLHSLNMFKLSVDHSIVSLGGPDRGLALRTLHQLDSLVLISGGRGLILDPIVHGGRVDDMATVCQLNKRGIFFILLSKEDLESFRMTGLAFVWTGLSTQTNTAMPTPEDQVTRLAAWVR